MNRSGTFFIYFSLLCGFLSPVFAADLSVSVSIEHSYIGDLTVTLTTPSSQTILLHDRSGGSTDDLNETYTVTSWDGDTDGFWILAVTDHAGSDTGELLTWSLTATPPSGPPVHGESNDTPLLIPDNDNTGIESYIVALGEISSSGLTTHFRSWLDNHGYGSFDFSRDELTGGSFGGKTSDSQPVTRQPVIFVHGNSDKAVGTIYTQTGWTASIDYFQTQGYTSAELYAITWGPANAAMSAYQYHSREYLTRIRAFIEAVYDYTNTDQVDIIGHSMGVTLARKAILGGEGFDAADGGSYNLGGPLTDIVDTFVGIAGGNRGLTACYLSGGTTPTCAATNGLYPGYLVGVLGPYGVSDILVDINEIEHYEGDYVFTIWSSVDQIIGYGCLVYGEYTPRIPGQDGEKLYSAAPYGHFNLKDLTAPDQMRFVTLHY